MTNSVLMLIKTAGLAYDDRLRKEVLSLRSLGVSVAIAALEDANRAERRVLFDDVSCETLRLRSRDRYGHGGGQLSVKVPELYARLLATVVRRRPDVVWFHNLDLAGMAPLLAAVRSARMVKRLIWDQHELPADGWLSNASRMRWFERLANRCDAVVMANEERLDHLHAERGVRFKPPVAVLHNYPDQVFAQLPREELPESVRAWCGATPYLLAQGGANPNRCLPQLAEALLAVEGLKLLIVGPYRPEQVEQLEARHGAALHERIRFTGAVPQLELAPFIDHALASVVLYAATDINNLLCAPNRLYQAMVRGIPVLVGSNPPMRDLVNRLRNGIVLASDGSDSADLVQGIRALREQHGALSNCAQAHQGDLLWEKQNDRIARLLEPGDAHPTRLE